MAPLPHYLRFARAAALVSLAAAPGCYASHLRDPGDVPDAEPRDARVADAGRPVDAWVAPDAGGGDDAWVDPCRTCTCFTGTSDPNSCEAHGLWMCCPAVGPLAPPDLPA